MRQIKRFLSFVVILVIVAQNAVAQINPTTEAPRMEFAMQLRVTLGESYVIDNTQHGRRTVIPITGGTFESPLLRGVILNGGADYQLTSADGRRTELEAIYSIKTDDGIYIHIRNRGVLYNGSDEADKPDFYFKAAPQFEAPNDSPYAWLNNAIFVCDPVQDPEFQGIVLNIWQISGK